MKRCDLCQKRPATQVIEQIGEEGQITELHICEECAKKKGVIPMKELKTIIQILEELKNQIIKEDTNLVCPQCSLTFANFKALGRLGCPECYSAFREKLQPIIKELHNADKHIGKKIGETTRQEWRIIQRRLEQELKEAIEKEDYEKAASIRDEMKKYEDKPKI